MRSIVLISLALLFLIGTPHPTLAQEAVTPISTIQSQISNGDDSAFVGQIVTVEGIVTGVYGDLFFVQDPIGGAWSGLAAYRRGHGASVGDAVRLIGSITEYYDLTEIEPTRVEILSRGNALPVPQSLSAAAVADERWEGVLVQLRDLTITTPLNQYNEWRVEDGSGSLLVDDKGVFYAAEPGVAVTSLTGIVDHAFGSYRLIPRTLADIVVAVDAPPTPIELTPIYAIQGNASASPLDGELVDTVGVVSAVGAAGFFLQDPVGDDDPLTSDGVYVYTYDLPVVDVGACVRVRQGLVAEFYAKTELSRGLVERSDLCASTALSPTLASLPQLNTDPESLLEALEGMVVVLEPFTATVQGPTKRFESGDVEIGVVATELLPYLPGGRVFQAEAGDSAALIFISNLAGADLPDTAWGDEVVVGSDDPAQPLLAVVDYTFGKYQLGLLPGQPVRVQPRSAVQDRPSSLAADEFGVCTFNLFGLGRGSAQYPDEAEYELQLRRRALAIAEGLDGCTIIGLQEAGTPADVENLAALLASEFELEYTAVAIAGPNSSSPEFPLTNGLLARSDRTEVVDAVLIQGCSTRDYEIVDAESNCADGEYPLFNRPPLVVDLQVTGDWDEPYPLTVIGNHWKSKSGDESVNSVRRMAQAEHVAALVQARLDADAAAHVVVLGDLNDFYGSEPVGALQQGTRPALIHTYDLLPALERYTYIFNGASQVLDHVLISRGMRAAFARIDPLHINADFPTPATPDSGSFVHASDHDPVQLTVRPAGAGWIGGNVGVPGVIVLLRNAEGGTVGIAISDGLGDFRFWNLLPGSYQIDFKTLPGLRIEKIDRRLQVRAGAGLFLHPVVHPTQTIFGVNAILVGAGLGTLPDLVQPAD